MPIMTKHGRIIFTDFAECESKARRKGIKNTGAYCAAVEHKITGMWPMEYAYKLKKKE